MLLDYRSLEASQIYKVMSQSVIPRPIAWIVTEDNGVVNAAPFSYFTPLSSSPATVIVSIGHKEDKTPKDTLYNIRKTKKATLCFVNNTNLDDMKNSSTALPKEESEVEKFDIETQYILDDFPPIISSTQSAMFCKLHSEIDLDGKTKPIILEIESQYFQDEIIDDNLNFSLDNIARVGKNFATMQDI